MRARNIKPGFCKNEKLAQCSPMARILFVTLPMLADYHGRLEYRPLRIKGELFPYEQVDVEGLFRELLRFGTEFVGFYAAGGERFVQITNFTRHQNPHKKEREAGTRIPSPDSAGGISADLSIDCRKTPVETGSTPGTNPVQTGYKPGRAPLIPDSGFRIPKHMCGRSTDTHACSGFDAFWKLYRCPPNRKRNKDGCRKKWIANGYEEMADQILACLQLAQQTSDWRKENGQFIPAPEVWINQKGWEAFLEQAEAAKRRQEEAKAKADSEASQREQQAAASRAAELARSVAQSRWDQMTVEQRREAMASTVPSNAEAWVRAAALAKANEATVPQAVVLLLGKTEVAHA